MREDLNELLAPAVEAAGCELWGIEYLPQGKHALLRVYIDSPEGITLEDCEAVSFQVSGMLDVHDPIKTEYNLEVSSPGLDRMLFTLPHYERYIGHDAKISLEQTVNNKRRIVGKISSVVDDVITITTPENEVFELTIGDIAKARLVG